MKACQYRRVAWAVLLVLASAWPIAAQGPSTKAELLIVGQNGVRVPKKTKNVLPVVPANVTPHSVTVLELIISPEGAVSDTKVLQAVKEPPEPALDSAAVEAAKHWAFEPTVVRGTPHPVKLKYAVDWRKIAANKK